LGRQGAAARRIAERERERTAFEEDNMMRLTVSRQERKERKRMMREETSNLNAIADLNNLVRESSAFDDEKQRRRNGRGRDFEDEASGRHGSSSERHANGRRKRQIMDGEGRLVSSKKKSPSKRVVSNSLQAALYGQDGNSKKTKRK
jgi:U3 small nucleolar ribonucleoprotein protein LCP5